MKVTRVKTIGMALIMLSAFNVARSEEQSGAYTLRTVAGTQLDYRKLFLSFDGDRVSGFFDNPFTQPASNDPDANPTCRFFLTGKLSSAGEVKLDTWYPTERGKADETGASVALKKRSDGTWIATLSGALPNCDVPTIATGDFLKLDTPQPWRVINYVAVPKSILYSAPADSSRTKAYLVRLDPVAVLETRSSWSRIDYLGKGGGLVRWVKSSDLSVRLGQ
ncbi:MULTISPECIES: hypothetical protein [Paraburkholderia]|uniref:SH3 domain-containing protein n=1 Tax=Paraburkholderia guartelaensis TaxID=2546446 RepID=A0ABU9S5N3_9BURK|nr:hypothetical protein [Paraburkholderia nodosa]